MKCVRMMLIILMFVAGMLLNEGYVCAKNMEDINMSNNEDTYSQINSMDINKADTDNQPKDTDTDISITDIKSLTEDYLTEIPMEDIDDLLSEELLNGKQACFADMVREMIDGGEDFSATDLLENIKEYIKTDILWDKSLIAAFFTGILSCAVFTSFTRVFSNKSLSETGFFVAYLVLFSVLSLMYNEAAAVVNQVMLNLFKFMKVLLPTFFLAVSISTGSAASMAMYETALGLLTMIDYAMSYVILPMVHFYFLLLMGASLSKEDRISRLVELIQQIIQWGIKLLLGIMIGIQAIEAMVVPVAGGFKKTVFTKGVAVVPGIGSSLSDMSDVVFGAGKMIQSAIGTAGIIFMVMICLLPAIKLLLISFIFQAASAIIQPISDKRVTDCVHGVGKASGMLVSSVFVGFLSFFFTIAILCIAIKT